MDNFSTRRNYIYQNQKIINFRKNHKFLRKFLKVIILVGFEDESSRDFEIGHLKIYEDLNMRSLFDLF